MTVELNHGEASCVVSTHEQTSDVKHLDTPSGPDRIDSHLTMVRSNKRIRGVLGR